MLLRSKMMTDKRKCRIQFPKLNFEYSLNVILTYKGTRKLLKQ